MNAPMILPWLARRAGVSDARAELLWHAACRQVALMTGERDGSRYWGAVQQLLLDMLATERWRAHPPLAWPWLLMESSLDGYSRLATRWRASMLAITAMTQIGRGGIRGGQSAAGRTNQTPTAHA